MKRLQIFNFSSILYITGILVIAGLLVFSSCKPASPPASSSASSGGAGGKLLVVTTILPLYDAARNIGGNAIVVRNLLPPGSSPHTYEPTPEDSQAVADADFVIKLGLGLDDWMDRILAVSKTGKKKTVVVASTGVPTLPFLSETAPAGRSRDEHGSQDPHIWMDPMRMKIIAGNVRDAFSSALPVRRNYFERNYENYAKQLDELDREYKEALAPFKEKDFVTFHSFLRYQVDRYGINQVAVIADFPGKEPDPHHIVEIIKILKQKGVKIVFVEPQFSPKASEAIAREIGGHTVVIDPYGSPLDRKRDTYIKNMQENLKALKEAFKTESAPR